MYKSVLILIILLFTSMACAQSSVSYLDGTAPLPQDRAHPTPSDGSVSAANPPSFVWMLESGAVSYILEYWLEGAEDSAYRVETVWNAHQPREEIALGKWFWRYRAVFEDGETSEWSIVREFAMPEDAVKLSIPTMEEMKANVLRGRPRIFVRPEGLEEFRESRFGARKERWEAFEKNLESRMGVDLWPEPDVYPETGRTPELWRENYREIRVMTNAMEMMAFGYLASGKREYADEAKRIMLYLTTWDSKGSSSYLQEDEMAMPIAQSTARSYDWIYDTFTPEERAKVIEMMQARLEELNFIVTRGPYTSRPYGSHLQRALMFLGEGSVSFMGEIEGCEEWLDYVLMAFSCLYPPWGGADGSYVEGPWYWSSYINHALQFIDAIQNATGADLYGKPFFRNTGWYVLYCVPPYNRLQPFGDGHWFRPHSVLKPNMYRLASIYRNPYFRWYADTHPSNLPNNHAMYLWQDDTLKAKSPADLPPSRAFYDAGLVAMHADLTGEKNVTLLMRSSPGGSWSHAFADQNSFYLQAFGEALAIPSGYRPFSGDEHHQTWTRQTRAHNAILVNGEGQIARSRASKGRIAETIFSDQFDYACGDAVIAYGGKLEKSLRHVLFLRPNYFVIVDELAAPEPSTFDWLLHAAEEMAIDEENLNATIASGDARLLTQWVWPKSLDFSQTDQFSAPTINNPSLADQWHLTATTAKPARNMEFVTVLHPYQSGDEASIPKIERIEAPGAVGVSIDFEDERHTVVLNKFKTPLAGIGISSDARIVALRQARDNVKGAFLLNGKSLSVEGEEHFQATKPVSMAMEISSGSRSIVLKSDEANQIKVKMQEAGRLGLHQVTLGRQILSILAGDMHDYRFFRGIVRLNGRAISNLQYGFDSETAIFTINVPAGEHKIEIFSR